jgi:myo-inositol-1(or 4)-monophosphatase
MRYKLPKLNKTYPHSHSQQQPQRRIVAPFTTISSTSKKVKSSTPTSSHNMEPTALTHHSGSAAPDSSPETSSTTSPSPSTPATTPSSTPDFTLKLDKHGLAESDLTSAHDLLISIAKAGGQMMLNAEHEFLVSAGTKNNTSDLVTKYDVAIETMVSSRLRSVYPEYSFLGEESYKSGQKLSCAPTFICDPIDGTLNFSRGFPNCAISLALAIDKVPVVGVVYNPFRGDMYTAIKHRGAWLTKMHTGSKYKLPLHPIPPPMPNLQSCLVALEWGNQRHGPNWDLRADVHKKLLTDKVEYGAFCKSVRSSGSAALDFCYVAQGILDVFWEGGVWVWDVAAGWIILEEAGGIVASANPGDWEPTLEGRVYFAVRQAKREEQMGIVEELWGIMGERKFVYP